MRTRPVIPRPVLETGAARGIAFTSSSAWGSKMRGAGWRSGEILSHVLGVGQESSTPVCLILPYSPLLPPKKTSQSHARRWEPHLTLHAPHDSPGQGGDPRPDAAPSSPSPSGGCGVPRAGGLVSPSHHDRGPRPAAGPVPCRMSRSQTAAPAVAAELPAPNNGAIEGLEPGVRPGRAGCGLRMGRTAEPACSTLAELQPKIGAWWPFGGWASLSGGHGLFARGDFVEYLWLGAGGKEGGSLALVRTYFYLFFGVKKAGLLVFLSPPHTLL